MSRTIQLYGRISNERTPGRLAADIVLGLTEGPDESRPFVDTCIAQAPEGTFALSVTESDKRHSSIAERNYWLRVAPVEKASSTINGACYIIKGNVDWRPARYRVKVEFQDSENSQLNDEGNVKINLGNVTAIELTVDYLMLYFAESVREIAGKELTPRARGELKDLLSKHNPIDPELLDRIRTAVVAGHKHGVFRNYDRCGVEVTKIILRDHFIVL